jgi:hypothetical protein
MIKAHSRARQGGDGRFYVTVRGEPEFMNPFYRSDDTAYYLNAGTVEDNCAFVEKWIEKNCTNKAEIFGSTSVVFDDESDAVLFWLTFKP